MRLAGILVVVCCVMTAPELRAQSDSTQTQGMENLNRLQPGTKLRIRMPGGTAVGLLQSISPDTLYLEDQSIPKRDIDRVWLQQRATRKGMKIGAIIGAPAGAAFGAFIIWIADALCESACGDLGTGELILGTLGFSAFGLVAGGTLGATIGAGIPRWVDIADSGVRIPERPPNRIGSVAITPTYSRFIDSDGGGFGARVSYTFETRHIAAGLEGGRYAAGTTQQQRFRSCIPTNVCYDTVAVSTDVLHVGGIARVSPGSDKRLEPYGSLGLGLYSWGFEDGGSVALGGYSVGAGIQMRNDTGKRSLFAEARWQSNLTRSGDPLARYGFYSVAIGAALAW